MTKTYVYPTGIAYTQADANKNGQLQTVTISLPVGKNLSILEAQEIHHDLSRALGIASYLANTNNDNTPEGGKSLQEIFQLTPEALQASI